MQDRLKDLSRTYEQLIFIHQILTQRTQYFLNEMDVAHDAAKTITEMANKVGEEFKELKEQEDKKAEEVKDEQDSEA